MTNIVLVTEEHIETGNPEFPDFTPLAYAISEHIQERFGDEFCVVTTAEEIEVWDAWCTEPLFLTPVPDAGKPFVTVGVKLEPAEVPIQPIVSFLVKHIETSKAQREMWKRRYGRKG